MPFQGNQQLYDNLTSITYQHILPTIQDVYFKVSTIFPFLFRPGNFEVFSGTNIQVPLQYAPLKGGPTVTVARLTSRQLRPTPRWSSSRRSTTPRSLSAVSGSH